jgi:hypothetical protein
MIWLTLGLLLMVCVVEATLHLRSKRPDQSAGRVDPEAEVKAAVELHRIRRRLDGEAVRHDQRRDASSLRREIHGVLHDDAE